MDRTTSDMEWQRHSPTTPRPGDRNGYLPCRLGGLCVKVCRQGDCGQLEHINLLELTAGVFAVKAFTKDRRNVHVHLRMDNTSALTYVSKTRFTRLTAVACQI